MNKRQKEVQQTYLDNEKAVLKKLEANYQDALDEINIKLEVLMARQDADMQHVIYQIEYQKALKTQVQAILEQLQTKEFETVSEYLSQSYEDGFIGTMYDLQGQGIPLVFPLDQKQVVAAIQHETKLSENLYNSLGKDIKLLNKQIAGEISRGISSGMMYKEIARNIANYGKIPKNNAMRIARTEAHRIQIKATSDAQFKAKEKGADVVKQWDSVLDGDTRPNHAALDGQIRELDEPFEVNGIKVMYPGAFNDPAEDCNCRCALLQRARWALGNNYTKWSSDAPVTYSDDGTVQLTIIEAKDYSDFQKQYKQASERVREGAQKMKAFDEITMGANVKDVNQEELKSIVGDVFGLDEFDAKFEQFKDATIGDFAASYGEIKPKQFIAKQKMREGIYKYKLNNLGSNTLKHNSNIRKQLGAMDEEQYIKQIMEDLGVSKGKATEYADIVHTFTRNGYKSIRNMADSSVQAQYSRKALEEFISASPKYDGNIYRGIKFDGDAGKQFVSQLVAGAEMDMRGISSWTSSLEYAKEVASNHNLEYQIVFSCKNKSGIGIDHISTMSHEKEVLQSANSRFKIIGVERNGNHYTVEMEEI